VKSRLPAEAAAVALAAAIVAAAVFPGNRLGLAASLVALGVLVAALLIRAGSPLLIVPAALLALAPVVRDADWVVVPDLVAAFLLTALAAAHGWAAMRTAVARTLASLFPGAPAVLAPFARMLASERIRTALPLLRGIALGGILLVVFGALFVSADAAFAEVVNETVPSWSLGDLPGRALVFALVASLAGALALSAAQPHVATEQGTATPRLGPADWIPAIALLDLLFAAFVVVQLAVLFGGHDHVLRTTGLTYAEYARQGFVELIVVAALTLAVAAAAGRYAARPTATQRRVLHVLVGILFALTLVVLASALRRLGLYEEAFGFTRTRLLAHGIILWLGALFLLVAALTPLGRARDLPRLTLALTAAGLVVATAANPDALIAARNADRFQATGRIDTRYLSRLSADAVPRLASLPPAIRACAVGSQAQRLRDGDGVAEWSIPRARARDALAGLPPAACKR
jgi:Domain of unknown function (DUF4153)